MANKIVFVTVPTTWKKSQMETLRDQLVEAVDNGGVVVAEAGVTVEILDTEMET